MEPNKIDFSNITASIMDIAPPHRVDDDVQKIVAEDSQKCPSYIGLTKSQKLFMDLLYTLDSSNFSSEKFDCIISLVVKSNDLKKYLSRCFMAAYEIIPLSTVTKLSVMFMLEGDGNNKRWVRFVLELMNRGIDNNSYKWVLELYSITRGSVVIRGRKCGIPFFHAHKGIKAIRDEAEKTLDELEKIRGKQKNFAAFLEDQHNAKKVTKNPLRRLFNSSGSQITNSADENRTKLNVNSIVIVSSRAFPGPDNTHFNYLINTISAVKRSKPEVELSLCVSGEDCLVSPWNDFGLVTERFLEFHKDKWNELNDGVDSIFPFVADDTECFDKYSRLEACISFIDAKKPSLVVFLTGVYESRVTLSLIHKKYQTMYLPTSLSHVPEKFFDYIISPSPLYRSKLEANGTPRAKIVDIPTVVNVFQDSSDFTDEVFVRQENEFILATVLGAGRLAVVFESYSLETINKLEKLFLDDPNFKWIFIGEPNYAAILGKSKVFNEMYSQGRLIFLDYVRKLRGFFRLVDAVFNIPDVTGAGQTLAAACYEGLPCISSIESDPVVYLPQSCIYSDVSEAVDILLYWSKNVSKRLEIGQSCKLNATACTPENAGKSWVDFLDEKL